MRPMDGARKPATEATGAGAILRNSQEQDELDAKQLGRTACREGAISQKRS
jgi:hypothetical protein